MKSKFVLMSLDEDENDKLTTLLSNKTAKKIVGYLSEHDEATQSEIAKELGIAISTVHYNLDQLQDAGLIEWEHYHYSQKGKEVRHYRLAQQYIIIAPKRKENLLETLKKLLPAFVVGIFGTMFLAFTNIFSNSTNSASNIQQRAMVADSMQMAAAPVAQHSSSIVSQLLSHPAFWFSVGCTLMLIMIFSTIEIQKYLKNKSKEVKQ